MNRKLVAVTGALMLSPGACTPAQTASYGLSNDSDYYKVQFRPDVDVQVSGGDN